MDDATPTQLDNAGFDHAVASGPALRLEFRGLSSRRLVLQSVLLAGAVRIRLLVRAWRRPEIDVDYNVAPNVIFLHRLSPARSDHDHGGPLSGLWRDDPGLALLNVQSE